MPGEHKSLMLAGFRVEQMRAGKHTLGQIVINDDVTVVFRMNDTGGSPFPDLDCLSCQISHISQCADLVCPDIKAHDPTASCADAIRECMKLACSGSCSSSGTRGGGLLVLA